jgi:hypothetical protein
MSIPFPHNDRTYGWRTNLGDIGEAGLAADIIESEYFTATATSFGKLKVGGVLTDIIASHIKIGGVMTSIISKKVKIGGILV